MEIKERYDVMERVCGRLVAAFDAHEYPYNRLSVRPPQEVENLPPTLVLGSRDHAMFLFNLCYWMRGGIQSDTAIRSLGLVYSEHPALFDPCVAMHTDPLWLKQVFTQFGLGWSKNFNSRFWVDNSRLLAERWDGDPRNLFCDFDKLTETEAWEAACNRIKKGKDKGFAGFREKMVSLLIYFLMASDLIDPFDFSLPIDFHNIRMAIILGFVELSCSNGDKEGTFGYDDKLLGTLRDLTYRYSKEHGVSSLKLCDVLWLYSRSMCSEHPSFQSIVGERNGRSTPVSRLILTWTDAQIEAHHRTCGVCHVAEYCKLVVRSAPYYIQGKIAVDKTAICPVQSLLPAEISRPLIRRR
ncbi:MAG: hypothetical protein PHU86_01510 [Patescibacteria group bacterium]|jgi:hypothetical protein|nr:hypothetical protein [Patescibacteria group bacterium]